MYELIARNELPVIKIDGATRIHADDLGAFAERRTAQQPEPQPVA